VRKALSRFDPLGHAVGECPLFAHSSRVDVKRALGARWRPFRRRSRKVICETPQILRFRDRAPPGCCTWSRNEARFSSLQLEYRRFGRVEIFHIAAKYLGLRPGLALRENRQGDAIFNRLIGPLAEMGKHRVGGVAQQHKPPACPRHKRTAIIQTPPIATLDRFEQSDNSGISSIEGRRKLLDVDGG
jgi:hypothetical protein